MRFRKSLLLGPTLVALLILAACAGDDPTPTPTATPRATPTPTATPIPTPTVAQEVTWAEEQTPFSADPHSTSGPLRWAQYWTMYDVLLMYGPNYELIPQLAESFVFEGDTWTLNLRKDVKFHNGDPFTAADVEFTINRVVEEGLSAGRFVPPNTRVEVVDDYTVRFITPAPDNTLEGMFHYVFIVPKNYLTQVGEAGFVENPVGSGLFPWKRFEGSTLFESDAIDHPFRSTQLDSLTGLGIGEVATMIAVMRSGGADLAHRAFGKEEADLLGREADLTLESSVVSHLSGLFMPEDAKAKGSPLADARVRQAVNYAFDRESICKGIFGSQAEGVSQLLLPIVPGHDPGVEPFTFNPDKARQLLAEAGVTSSFDVVFSYWQAGAVEDLWTAIAAQVGELELINAKQNKQELGVFVDEIYGRVGLPRESDVLGFSNPMSTSSFDPMWARYSAEGLRGAKYYNNPVFEDLRSKAKQSSPTESVKYWRQLSRLSHDEALFVHNCAVPDYHVFRKDVSGYQPWGPGLTIIDNFFRTS